MAKRAGKGVRVSAMKEKWKAEFRRMMRA